jgi:hypothetical protein
MSLALKCPESGKEKKTYACMFDIPYVGDNSLFATLETQSDYQSFYKNADCLQKVTQFYSSDNELDIVVTYDYLSGAHTNLETGTMDYIYNSLVVIREKL